MGVKGGGEGVDRRAEACAARGWREGGGQDKVISRGSANGGEKRDRGGTVVRGGGQAGDLACKQRIAQRVGRGGGGRDEPRLSRDAAHGVRRGGGEVRR